MFSGIFDRINSGRIAGDILEAELKPTMSTYRKYGNPPFTVALLHGGPGAPGEMATLARELCSLTGIIEPLQGPSTIEGQVEELKALLERWAMLPLTLIGFSWGAMLGFIFTSRYPELVKKLILISSGSFEDKYAEDIFTTRLNRLDHEQRKEVFEVIDILNHSGTVSKNSYMQRFGELMFIADSYDPLPHKSEVLEYQYETNRKIWKQASELRKSGVLLELGKNIHCSVVVFHGDYDPHLADGVKLPLSRVLKNLRFILLKKCGHYPWVERHTKQRFYTLLKREIRA